MAIEDNTNDYGNDLRANINWDNNTMHNHKTILATTVIAPLDQTERTTLTSLNEKPFYLDS
ncbi:hypothetical protein C0992_000764, partial [Termitomyces sp. T32_za158]